ncbi:DUF1617 family protein [Lactococcus lactis]|uniref:DUF1617 family protein n=1 Tax=Lactococcus lactis TaxID=1358 RepID=UPI001C10C279|nr:DUF1617 family protein [Lactococcus lactis]MBU5243707.1 DUF1617 family protein [Lactococcus lactis]
MLKFKNGEIQNYANFLSSLPLKNKASRARTQLISKLDKKFSEYAKFQREIIDKYAVKDEQGELEKDEQGNFHWVKETMEEAVQSINELSQEEVYLNLEEYRPNIKFLTLALEEIDVALSGQDALIYDGLMEQLEEETKGE